MKNSTEKSAAILTVDLLNIDHKDIQKIATVVSKGGVIVYPTDTIYGLGCDAFNEKAVEKVYRVKRRPERKPMLVLVYSVEMATTLSENISPSVMQLMHQCWPGPLTIIVKEKKEMYPWLSAGTGKIGIRYPRHNFCQDLVKELGRPLLSTSANISGEEYTNDIHRLRESFSNEIDLLVDAGTLPDSMPSTVLDVTGEIPVLIREGAFPRSELQKYIETMA